MKTDFIPWTCHCCGRGFDTLDGAPCKKCGELTCSICYAIAAFKRIAKLKMPRFRICRYCVSRGVE